MEFGVGLVSRCFAAAEFEPDILNATLTPLDRLMMARRLLLRGNAVYAIDISEFGNPILLPASSFHIVGGVQESSWRYGLNLPAPTFPESRNIASEGVVHIRYGADETAPWYGCSPLLNAGLSSALLARIELRTGQEAGAPVGHLLPVPEGMTEESITMLKADLSALKGNTALVEAQGTAAVKVVAMRRSRTGSYSGSVPRYLNRLYSSARAWVLT